MGKGFFVFGAVLAVFAVVLAASCSSSGKAENNRPALESIQSVESIAGFDDSVKNKEWFLEEVKTAAGVISINRAQGDIDFSGIYSLTFDEHMASGVGAPNRYSAPYSVEGNSLNIGLARTTLMASIFEPEGLKEHEFYAYLDKVSRWSLNDGKLELICISEDGSEAVLFFAVKG